MPLAESRRVSVTPMRKRATEPKRRTESLDRVSAEPTRRIRTGDLSTTNSVLPKVVATGIATEKSYEVGRNWAKAREGSRTGKPASEADFRLLAGGAESRKDS